MPDADRGLVSRCRLGDERAWGDLYRRYAPRMARFLRGMIGREDVEDLVQRVFLEFLTSLGRFRGESSLATWLYRIAAHVAHKEIRRLGRQRRGLASLAAEISPDSASRPDLQLQARRGLLAVASAVAELDERLRMVWVLREIEGLSVEESADALDIGRATVRTRHHRARGRVMAALAEAERVAVRGRAAPVRAPVQDEQEVLP